MLTSIESLARLRTQVLHARCHKDEAIPLAERYTNNAACVIRLRTAFLESTETTSATNGRYLILRLMQWTRSNVCTSSITHVIKPLASIMLR